MFKKGLLVFSMLALLVGFSPAKAEARGNITLTYVEWDCAVASTYVVQAVLQEELGYNVEVLPVGAAAMWQAVATGDADGMVTAWLPVTHAGYFEQLEGRFENLGPLAHGAKIGLVVPDYVTISSIEEMNANADKFRGRIVGIDPGAGIMSRTEEAIVDYGLNNIELVEGSGATMAAALQDAIQNEEWVAVTGWSPHWKFGRWSLKYLDDPKGVYGEEEHIATIVRQGLSDDMPEVYSFLDNFYWTQEQMATVMVMNQERGADPYESAKTFISDNPELVNQWLGR
ncbi:glycine betaine ABC transporter substrate-binding protein [Desulfonatronovibrio hydrogenovorans]|uniref:glycine betaine ABC transporter substrate-binding protein n=1 Tax=Desulfonatronovibrio hydrogenovorans TaxID=53245 RepID=UPI00049084A0|nr:glycine betaine ABC transporter substrate-binding protein [Desulfonatronovibrio hydrogenovorans]